MAINPFEMRTFWSAVLLLVTLVFQGLCQRPNILLIVSHGHGKTDLGCYGNQSIKTPNLDKLATEGILFPNAYESTANYSASHAAILTGTFNHANGQLGISRGIGQFAVYPGIKSVSQILKENGYFTARIGHLAASPETNFPFDTVLCAEPVRNSYHMAEKSQSVFSQSSPFFLFVSLADPYRDLNNAGESLEINKFGNSDQGYYGMVPTFYKPNKIDLPPFLPDKSDTRKEFAQYAQAVSRLDLGLGRFFEHLRNAGKWDNTLIVYLSSEGPSFPGAQGTLYQTGINLPCIVKPPLGFTTNHSCNAMINWVDIVPTLLDFAQIHPSENFHGRSFKETMAQKSSLVWNSTFASQTFQEITMYYPMRMVIDGRYKLIWNITWQLPFPILYTWISSATWGDMDNQSRWLQRPEYELYDIINDPLETNNLATQPTNSVMLNEMKEKLKNWQITTNDPWVMFNK